MKSFSINITQKIEKFSSLSNDAKVSTYKEIVDMENSSNNLVNQMIMIS